MLVESQDTMPVHVLIGDLGKGLRGLFRARIARSTDTRRASVRSWHSLGQHTSRYKFFQESRPRSTTVIRPGRRIRKNDGARWGCQ